jgi:hypothetical protein
MASAADLISAFQPTLSMAWEFGGEHGVGSVHFKAGASGDAGASFDLMALNSFGHDITDSLAPEVFQRMNEARLASQSNRS